MIRVPRSTYRLQVTPTFLLSHAAAVLDYLHELGVDWVYLSPVTRAVEGSEHGYDVASPLEIDPLRGGEAAFQVLADAAHRLGMGVMVDTVPNHQGIAVPQQNPWWWSVLEQGPASPHARAFDIDWEAGGGQVLLPVLGSEADLEGLRLEGGLLYLGDLALPVAPGTLTPTDTAQQVYSRQHYRLIPWREGDSRLNYRRFFTITTLAGVRAEDPAVLEASHQETVRWVRSGLVDGLRIDHPDGLRDPGGYLAELQRLTGGVHGG
ncbi:alpha-amylase family glycosyl hydrolase [Deinococcus lacus]|uniref:Alpha-amylase family glycosyl hydrolase n=1 Tax=Deinococcus lacus TaxID=392561 RepID=A0ABW1YEC0_9DEIO